MTKKTKQEIIEGCTNEHDRKIMIKELNRFDKTINRSYALSTLGFVLAVISILTV